MHSSIHEAAPHVGVLAPTEQARSGMLACSNLQWWIAPGRLALLDAAAFRAGHPTPPASLSVVLVTEVSPSLAATVTALMLADTPLVCRDTAEARRLLGMGAHFVDAAATWEEVAAELETLLRDPGARETLIRKGRAQARRLQRLLERPASEESTAVWSERRRMPPPSISVIIPTTGGENVHRCVEALRSAGAELELQVILVVTGGAGSLPACDELVRCDPPFVWAKANNAALQVATGSWVLLLNDDAFFTEAGDLCRLLDIAAQWPYLAALGPLSPGISRYFQQYAEAPIEGGIFVPTERPLCGHCLLIRRECFDAVGPFDETFTAYGGDELDWLYRARQLGYRWGLHEGIFVEHLGAATFGGRAREWQAGKERFEAKHGVPLELSHPWTTPRPEVSWVIASYDAARYLSHCLDSLRACSRGLQYEIVLAVDGSDPLPYQDVLRHYADLPLRVVFFRKAASVGEAKNRALRLARGRVVFPFDDDDFALPGHRELLEVLDAADAAYGELLVRWDTGKCTDFPREPATFESLLQRHPQSIFPAQCSALPRSLTDRYHFREDLPACEDYELWLRMTRDGLRLRHVPQPVAVYNQRPGSCSKRANLRSLNEELRAEYDRYVPAGVAPERPVYSYVITAWNEAERLRRCLESLLACAPDKPFEVVLADDGSTDATLAVAAAFLERLPLRIHPFPKAPTVSLAYNRALRQARGEFMLLMDADDETTPERVPGLRAALDSTGADFVYGSYLRLTPRGPELYRPPEWTVARTAGCPAISPCAAMFHRRILAAGVWLREELPAGEDTVWMLDIDRAGFHIAAAPEVLAHRYWMRPGSIIKRHPVLAIERRYSPLREAREEV